MAHRWANPPHLQLLNQKLIQVAFGSIKRLIVNMPAQVGKSEQSSRFFPTWYLLHFPEKRLMLAGYGGDFAETWGRKVRDLVQAYGPEIGIKVRTDYSRADEWQIEGHEGGMVAKGIQGGLTGRPADLFIMDDPLKSAQDATSLTIKDRIWDEFQSTVYGRLGPDAPILVIMTRWAIDDLTGRIIEQAKTTGEKWEVISIPALAVDKDDPLGRKPGESIWEERKPAASLKIMSVSNVWWQPCFQQNPEAGKGRLFQPSAWPKFRDIGGAWKMGPKIAYHTDTPIIITVDPASSDKETADHTCMIAAAIVEDEVLILEVLRERLKMQNVPVELDKLCRKWNPVSVGIEATGFAERLIEDARSSFRHIPSVQQLVPLKGKFLRAVPAIQHGGNGRIWLPEEHFEWMEGFKLRLALFSGDGQVSEDDHEADALAWCCQMAEDMGILRPSSPFSLGGAKRF